MHHTDLRNNPLARPSEFIAYCMEAAWECAKEGGQANAQAVAVLLLRVLPRSCLVSFTSLVCYGRVPWFPRHDADTPLAACPEQDYPHTGTTVI